MFFNARDLFAVQLLSCCCCCLPASFRRMRGVAEDHGALEAGKLASVRTKGRRVTESRQRVSGAKSP